MATKKKAAKPTKATRVRGLRPRRAAAVKGGEVNHSEFKIVKLLDAATPKL